MREIMKKTKKKKLRSNERHKNRKEGEVHKVIKQNPKSKMKHLIYDIKCE